MCKSPAIQFSIVTPLGRGAIATVIIVGNHCIELVNKLFRPKNKQPIGANQKRRAIYGNWIVDGQLGEDLIVCPLSDNRVEVHCHGGAVAIEVIANTLQKQGAQRIESSDFGPTIFGNHYLADFNWTVVQAQTLHLAKLILAQREIQKSWFKYLLNLIENNQATAINDALESTLDWWRLGRHFSEPWRVVLCGKPNVGKSSLTNAIVGFHRAIVDDVAGTTRDVVDQVTAIEGWPVRIVDTAGIRRSENEIESIGIALAQKNIELADCIVLVMDSLDFSGEELNSQLDQWHPDIVAINKSDLKKSKVDPPHCLVSAKTGAGLSNLMQKIVEILIPKLPSADTPIPISQYQYQLVTQLHSLTNEGRYQELAANIRKLHDATDRSLQST